ncbi:uncharacterized protein LOC108828890 [Raphanus sativus]|uniref:Uncharacterized protein LOC108828890 n=1 Tax=Raphanus sativus TaxID=3726 RepID=A0A6J0LD93_RAPSA|nr:uncharacterized protein LOC108828890 [Raphanus sativus]
MSIGDSNPVTSGEAPELTPPPPPPFLSSDFMSSVMARLAHQEEVQKTTNEQLAALVAALTAPAAPTNRSQTVCRHLFPPTPAEDHAVDESDTNGPPAVYPTPTTADSTTIREIAELKPSLQQMSSQIHQATSAAPQIDSVIASTSRSPFASELTRVQLRKIEKLRLPEYKPGGDPVEHLTAFNIAMARARLSDEEKDAGYCQLFVETLNEQALTWFSQLSENSIRSFRDLSAVFLKTYIMFTKRAATASSLWNMAQTKNQSLKDYMEKFKTIVSRVDVPDHIAIDALMNTLLVNSKFRKDLYSNPTTSLPDAIARSHNFIRMEEDTKAIIRKQNAAKPAAAKSADARTEPRQHAPGDTGSKKGGLLYVVDENNAPVSTMVMHDKKWNVYQRETDSPDASPSTLSAGTVAKVDSATGPTRTPIDLTKHCKYHDVKGHDTTECKSLYAQFLSSIESGDYKIQPPKPKPKGENSWSRNKDKKDDTHTSD